MKSLRKKKNFVREVLSRLEKQNPHPTCELYYETPFQLLISVVLSAQATDKMVNRCMEPIYRQGFAPENVLDWGESGFKERIKTIGLANTKARNVRKIAEIIIKEHGNLIPSTREQLEALPGVGKKTASVVLGELYQHPSCCRHFTPFLCAEKA